MKDIEIMNEEHKYILRMLSVVRKCCFKILQGEENIYEDFDKIIDFIRNYADNHHHKKEEKILFVKMVEHLGDTGKNIITHGMLVEHDLGRSYIRNLEEALNKYKNGEEEAKLDIVANAVSYTTLLENHIHKEDNVIFNFAKRSLNEDIRKVIDEECFEYEEKNSFTREENIGILKALEDKYI